MRDKRRFALCIVGTLMAMALLSTSAAMAADEILSPISEQISGTVVVLTEKAEHPAQLVSTGKLLEGDDNKIYEEFELRDDSGNTISLSPDNIERLTVKRQGDQLSKNLNPEGDTLYWDVLTQTGIYHFTFETKVEIYRAELDWTSLNLINLTWDLPENLTTLVQRSEQICIQAALTDKINSAGIQQIAGVVYVFEITKDGVPIGPNDVYLVYESETLPNKDGKFLFGGDQGFLCSDGMDHKFTIQFRTAGTFQVTVHAAKIN